MHCTVQFTDGPICSDDAPADPGAGAVVEFSGVVRGMEGGTAIPALIYEIYDAMAERVIRGILEDLDAAFPCRSVLVIHRRGVQVFEDAAFPCRSVLVIHRRGVVPAGEASIFVRITAAHRGEAFHMLEQFMHRMKADAPIWKRVAC